MKSIGKQAGTVRHGATHEPRMLPPGFGVRQSSGALRGGEASESGRRLPQSKMRSRRLKCCSVHWPNARPMLEVETFHKPERPLPMNLVAADVSRCALLWVVLGLLVTSPLGAARAAEELFIREQPGWMFLKERDVRYRPGAAAEFPATVPQPLDYDGILRTLSLSRAAVRLHDQSQLRLRELTRLEIRRQPLNTNAPLVRLHEGQIYVSSRGKPVGLPFETTQTRGVPKGTEFLVSTDPLANSTEVTMFDGEAELFHNDHDRPSPRRRTPTNAAVASNSIKIVTAKATSIRPTDCSR